MLFRDWRHVALVAATSSSLACAAASDDDVTTTTHHDGGADDTSGDAATTTPPSGDSAVGFDSASSDTGGATDGAVGSDSTPPSDAAVGGPLHIERVYGDGTSLMGSWGAGVTLGVLVTDASGKPAPGIPIVWSARPGDFAYFPGAGGASTLTWPTDATGWSTPNINAPNPTVAVIESVLSATLSSGATDRRDFFVETTNNGDALGPAGQQAFTGTDTPNHSALGPYTVGSIVSNALTFTVVCSNASRCSGGPLANVSVRINMPDPAFPAGKSDPKIDPPAECVGIEPLSDAKGFIHCDLKIKRKFSGVIRAAVGQFVEFEYTVTAS